MYTVNYIKLLDIMTNGGFNLKRFAAFFTALLLLCQAPACFSEEIGLRLDGNGIKTETAPFFADNVVMVPLRSVMESLGFRVFYNDETKEIFVLKDSEYGSVKIGSSHAVINGDEAVLEAKTVIVNGTAMTPVRFVSRMSQRYISYDLQTHSVIISVKGGSGGEGEILEISPDELLINPAMENDMSSADFGWKKYGYGNIELYEDNTVFGKNCIRIKDRTSKYSGVSQDITKILNENGAGTYLFTAYIRTYEGSPSVGNTYSMIVRTQETTAEKEKYAVKSTAISDKWTKITLKAELDFSDELKDGLLYFEGSQDSDLNDYYIDMCSMTKADE